MTQHTDLPSDLLPATVRDFFGAHVVRDADTASSFLAEDAVVGPYAVLGDRCQVGSGATVADSLLWDDVVVEP